MAGRARRNNPLAKCSDADFINLIDKHGIAKTGRKLGITVSAVYQRRRCLERLYHRQITAPGPLATRHNIEHAPRLHYDCLNGVVLVGSDAHIWPGPMTTAMRGFIKLAKELQPRIVVMNGDALDLPQVSRHPPIGWQKLPSVEDEVRAAQDVLAKIEDAVPGNCKLSWPLGNHDARFETRLATTSNEFAKMHGFSLKDHFPAWAACWSTWVNNTVVIKHRMSGGIGAVRNNTLKAGKSIVTGHLHSLKVTPYTDYNGDRYGVDSGCLADPAAEAFLSYTEDGCLDWRSGFVVLTFHKGKLLPPELVQVWDKKHVVFRGQIIEV